MHTLRLCFCWRSRPYSMRQCSWNTWSKDILFDSLSHSLTDVVNYSREGAEFLDWFVVVVAPEHMEYNVSERWREGGRPTEVRWRMLLLYTRKRMRLTSRGLALFAGLQGDRCVPHVGDAVPGASTQGSVTRVLDPFVHWHAHGRDGRACGRITPHRSQLSGMLVYGE